MSVLGIDLGTTNTVAAVDYEVLELESDDGPSAILPSVVAYPPRGLALIGAAAFSRRASDPKNTIISAKRIIGQSWFAYRTRKFAKTYPFDLVNHDGQPAFKTRAGLKTPVDVGAVIVTALRERAAALTGAEQVVICAPSSFQPEQREATEQVCQQAGFGDVRVIEEPVATAAAYLHAGHQLGTVAVYDFGGGTFDLAIIDCSRRPVKVLAHFGDAYLGGDDIDRSVAKWVADQVLERYNWDLRGDRITFGRLVARCEQVKIHLSAGQEEEAIDIAEIDDAAPPQVGSVTVTRALLDELCLDLVRRTFGVCDQALDDAGVIVDEIEAVLLAGGTTLLPVIHRGIGQYFQTEVLRTLDPTRVVGQGASVAPEVLGGCG